MSSFFVTVLCVAAVIVAPLVFAWLIGIRYIPHNKVGIVEKLWSMSGSLEGGRIISTEGKAGFQAEMLRGGLHFGYYPWQYRIHRQPLVMISESRIGYVYARDGEPLPPTQTLGRVAGCNDFQDAYRFMADHGQRGRQRAILREGVYAINLAQFVVITENGIYSGPVRSGDDRKYSDWHADLKVIGGFSPVLIGHGGLPENPRDAKVAAWASPDAAGGGNDLRLTACDTIGVVTVHDGPPIESGEIIAPEVHAPKGGQGHQYFQSPEVFLSMGGRRGKQLQVLTDGTFFINRWFATVEMRPKTLVPIGYVGVVVSYCGVEGEDVTGSGFRYGEQVEAGHRGVWKHPLPTGKYALNPYALKVELVPTINFVLRWVTGLVEDHEYDKDLKSIELITADGYEPLLPLSLVLHIDYQKAPRVVQRFGDVKRLISQTLDPILSAYFRDVAQSSNMLDLLTKREEIQRLATQELGRRFQEYDINCISVLIGRPESKPLAAGAEDQIETLFDQLRQRRLAEEQQGTFGRQQAAAEKQRELNEARAAADKQTELTQTRVDIEIAGNKGEAQLAAAQRLAKRDVARAEGEGRAKDLLGKGEASRIAQTGGAEAAVSLKKIRAFGDPRLFALSRVGQEFAHSAQPLVPERLMVMGGGENSNGNGGGGAGDQNLFSKLITLLLAERGGVKFDTDTAGVEPLDRLADGFSSKLEEDKHEQRERPERQKPAPERLVGEPETEVESARTEGNQPQKVKAEVKPQPTEAVRKGGAGADAKAKQSKREASTDRPVATGAPEAATTPPAPSAGEVPVARRIINKLYAKRKPRRRA
jgi:uncharacterized membrane protein YqiK